MLYREIMAVCSQFPHKTHKYNVWAERTIANSSAPCPALFQQASQAPYVSPSHISSRPDTNRPRYKPISTPH